MWTSFVGFMASGKTSVTRVLGERALLPARDLDAEVEARASLTVPAWFTLSKMALAALRAAPWARRF